MTNGQRHQLPACVELTHIHPNVEVLIAAYNKIAHRKNDEQFYQYAEIKPATAAAFPIPEGGYEYTAVTDISNALRDQWQTASPQQMYKWAARGNAPALDDRNFTNIMDDVPIELRGFLQQFRGAVSRTRFAVLKSNHHIKEHIDNDVHHTIRIHIPLISDQYCVFGARTKNTGLEYFNMEVGKVYFLNSAIPHFVINGSPNDRLHLIVNLNDTSDLVGYVC